MKSWTGIILGKHFSYLIYEYQSTNLNNLLVKFGKCWVCGITDFIVVSGMLMAYKSVLLLIFTTFFHSFASVGVFCHAVLEFCLPSIISVISVESPLLTVEVSRNLSF